MSDVFCRKYQTMLPALNRPPFPGDKGKIIMETISQQAWQEWLQHQTRLVNEKHLNLMASATRDYLEAQRELFFDGGDYDLAQGFIDVK